MVNWLAMLNKYSQVDVNLNIDENNPEISTSDADVTDYYRLTEPGKILHEYIKRCAF